MVIKTIRNLQELETVRPYWEGWQFHPNSNFDHFRLVCQLRREVVCPYIIIVECDGQPRAAVVGRLERTKLSLSVGYFKPVRIPAKVLTVIYQGLLGKVDVEMGEAVVRHLWSVLASGEADVVAFHHLPRHSPLLVALMRLGPLVFCEKNLAWSPHWSMELPDQPGALLVKFRSNHRRRILKKEREIESAFRGRISWRWHRYFDDIPGLCAMMERAAALTYQRGLSEGFMNNEEYRQRFALLGARQELRAQLLEIDGRVRAFWVGNVCNNVFYASETGYDPDLREFEVGTLGFLRTVDELVREGVRRVDFGFGDADYKKRFASQCWEEATVRLFAPTAAGLALRVSLGVSGLLDTAGRNLLRKTGGLNRLKAIWRRRLVPDRPSANEK